MMLAVQVLSVTVFPLALACKTVTLAFPGEINFQGKC